MLKHRICQFLFLFVILVCAVAVAAPETYQFDSEKSLPFEWNDQKYEWRVVSFAVKDDFVSHGSSGALHVVLNQIDGDQKTEVASTAKDVACGSNGFCEVFNLALEKTTNTLPLLQIQAGIYAGQGHIFSSAFLMQVDGREIGPALCWFRERQGECADQEYKFTVRSHLIMADDKIKAVELQAQGTRCADADVLEVQNRQVQIPYQKKKFKPDAKLVGELTCYTD